MADGNSTTTPEFRLNGLFGDSAHPSVAYVTERTLGWLTGELNESVRKRIAELQGRDIGPKSPTREADRKAIKLWSEDPINKAAYTAIRVELRDAAQSEFDAGTYGDRTRGPQQASPRVLAVFDLIVRLQAARKDHPVILNPDDFTASAKVKAVAEFEALGKYTKQISEATAHLPKPPTSSALAGL